MVSRFPDTLRLKEMAEEDIYFARRDRELIAALRHRRRCRSCAAAQAGSGSAEESGGEADRESGAAVERVDPQR